MSLSRHFKTDADLERKGVGIQFPENDDGTIPEIYICRAGRNNPDYQKVVERVMKPHRRAAQVGALSPKKQDELTQEIFCEAGIVGWKNVSAADVTGDPAATGYAEYTKDNAILLCKNLPEVYVRLIELATDHTTFQQAAREEDAKNSAKSLPMSTNKAAASAS